jgi:hypothetical protein
LCAWVIGAIATVCSCFNEHDEEGDQTFNEITGATRRWADRVVGCVDRITGTEAASFEKRMVAVSIRLQQLLSVLQLVCIAVVLDHGVTPYTSFASNPEGALFFHALLKI